MNAIIFDRRRFLVTTAVAAGGMMLSLSTARAASGPAAAAGPWGPDYPTSNEFNAFLEIAADDMVTLRSPNPESGNGTMTQMAMNVAEELACDWSKIRVEIASLNRDYRENHVYTKGFLAFFSGHATDAGRLQYTLQLGASARERLKAAAAERWQVPAGDIAVKDSVLTHRPSGRTLRFGEVAAAAARIALPAEPALKPRSEWTLLGKKTPSKLHIPAVAHGTATYGIDVKLPGMVHAALRQVPVMGGTLKSVKPEAVKHMPGVRAVVIIDPAKSKSSPVKEQTTFGIKGTTEVQHAVAVIADHFWQAKLALQALPVEWDLGAGAAVPSADAIYKAMAAKRDSAPGKSLLNTGDVTSARGGRVVEAEYLTPYADNAVMEPLNGTALVTADKVEVWAPAQDTLQAYWVSVDETGMAPEKVMLHGTYMGGNFGRRTQAEEIRMVVAVAKEYPGVPVKTIWTREEMFRQGRYRTPVATRFKAVLDDATGLPLAVTGHANFAGDRPLFHLSQGYLDPPYFNTGVIPHVSLAQSNLPVHVLNGAYRGPCFNSHAFITETFIDECAHAAGIDPLEYRLKLLAKWEKSWSDCLKIAAQKAGWGRKLPRGEGLGIAITSWPIVKENMGSVSAVVARVSVSKAGEVSVRQIDAAFDCGRVANEDAVSAMVEGGTLFGLNMTLNEETTLKDGAMVEGNFDAYPMLRMADAPRVNVHFGALSGNDRFDIMGEVPTGPIGPAVGNAIFAATGKRLRSTPFRKQDLRWA
jgi:isoquinoline 1-oxidoreductase beta subunit